MGYLIEHLWLPMLLCGLLGIAAGWWVWHRPADEYDDGRADKGVAAPVIPPAPPEREPVVESEPLEEPAPEMPPVTAAPEPVAVAATPAAPPAEASPFMDAPDGEPDDLRRIKGVGPKLNDLLYSLGVFHFRQIADWNAAQVAEVDSHLGSFTGRIERDRWVDQARYLAAEDIAGFEAEFGATDNQI